MTFLYESLRALYRDEKYCDLTVSCGSRHFKVHRAIICPQSPFFDKACSSGFQETFTGRVDLPEDDPDIFDKFVQFIYTGNYEDEEHLSPNYVAEPAALSLEDLQDRLATAHGIAEDDCSVISEEFEDGDADYDATCDMDSNINEGNDDEEESDDEEEDGDEEESEASDAEDVVMNDAQVATGTAVVKTTSGQPRALIFPEMDGYISETSHAMFTSLRVYAMADKFCVPSLKLLARDRFYRSVERYATSDDFPAVIDELYETTSVTDLALKDICCRIIAPIYYGDFRRKIQPVMHKYGQLATGVLHYTILEGTDLRLPGYMHNVPL